MTSKTRTEHTPSTCITDVEEFIKEAKKICSSSNSRQLTAVEDRIVMAFIVDKRRNKIVKSSKYYIIKMLVNLGVNSQQIVKGKDFTMWEILLPISKDCVAQKEGPAEHGEYRQCRTKGSIFEVPSFILGQQVSATLMQYGELVEIHPDKKLGKWMEVPFDAKPGKIQCDPKLGYHQ